MNESVPDPDHTNAFTMFCFASVTEPKVINQVAALLGRAARYTDLWGYECELLAAALDEPTGRVAYLESRAKKKWWSSWIDVTIKVHLRDADGRDRFCDIQTYNPFFGCGVFHFEWYDETAVLIYEEKHAIYACTCSPHWPPKFVELGDFWVIKDNMLGYRSYQQEQVQRLMLPTLTPLEPLSLSDAEAVGLVPVDMSDQE